MTQLSDHFRSRVTSKFINAILRVLQKLLKYSNDTTVFTFAITALLVLSVILDLHSNDLEFVILPSGSSLQYFHKLADVLHNYQ